MEDFFAGGGLGAVLREIEHLLHLDTLSITGETLGDRLSEAPGYIDPDIVRPLPSLTIH